MEKIEDKVEELINKTPKNGGKVKKFFKNLGRQIAKQVTAIFGIAIASAIGVIVAKLVWEWIQYVWSWQLF